MRGSPVPRSGTIQHSEPPRVQPSKMVKENWE